MEENIEIVADINTAGQITDHPKSIWRYGIVGMLISAAILGISLGTVFGYLFIVLPFLSFLDYISVAISGRELFTSGGGGFIPGPSIWGILVFLLAGFLLGILFGSFRTKSFKLSMVLISGLVLFGLVIWSLVHASAFNSEFACSLLGGGPQNKCFANLAIDRNDPTICEKTRNPGYGETTVSSVDGRMSYGEWHDFCYFNIAKNTMNVSLCDKIFYPDTAKDCYYESK